MGKRKKKNKKWKTTRTYKPMQQSLYPEIDYYKRDFLQAFKVLDLQLWGGPQCNVALRGWDCVVSLGEFNRGFLVTDIYSYKHDKIITYISIPWINNDVPKLSRADWDSIIKELPKSGNVAVCCTGGTGRTGTALAILYALLNKTTSDPIFYIRNYYKKDAVETDIQIEYVKRITGIDSQCKGSNELNTYYLDDWNMICGGWDTFESCYDKDYLAEDEKIRKQMETKKPLHKRW